MMSKSKVPEKLASAAQLLYRPFLVFLSQHFVAVRGSDRSLTTGARRAPRAATWRTAQGSAGSAGNQQLEFCYVKLFSYLFIQCCDQI